MLIELMVWAEELEFMTCTLELETAVGSPLHDTSTALLIITPIAGAIANFFWVFFFIVKIPFGCLKLLAG